MCPPLSLLMGGPPCAFYRVQWLENAANSALFSVVSKGKVDGWMQRYFFTKKDAAFWILHVTNAYIIIAALGKVFSGRVKQRIKTDKTGGNAFA